MYDSLADVYVCQSVLPSICRTFQPANSCAPVANMTADKCSVAA